MNALINGIAQRGAGRQAVIATHSSFVVNKLGMSYLTLLGKGGKTTKLTGLSPGTQDYFMKLPGYNTLRLLLASITILVEGPSDELIVQRAYKSKHGKLPLENGVDVISVGSLSFSRFLEIGKLMNLTIRVVADNDGDVDAIKDKYRHYLESPLKHITICYDDDESCPTLEPQMLKANSLSCLNRVFGTKFTSAPGLLKHMRQNKTDCALKLFNTTEAVAFPQYICDAIK